MFSYRQKRRQDGTGPRYRKFQSFLWLYLVRLIRQAGNAIYCACTAKMQGCIGVRGGGGGGGSCPPVWLEERLIRANLNFIRAIE